jgi:hypothetical protein
LYAFVMFQRWKFMLGSVESPEIIPGFSEKLSERTLSRRNVCSNLLILVNCFVNIVVWLHVRERESPDEKVN